MVVRAYKCLARLIISKTSQRVIFRGANFLGHETAGLGQFGVQPLFICPIPATCFATSRVCEIHSCDQIEPTPRLQHGQLPEKFSYGLESNLSR